MIIEMPKPKSFFFFLLLSNPCDPTEPQYNLKEPQTLVGSGLVPNKVATIKAPLGFGIYKSLVSSIFDRRQQNQQLAQGSGFL